VLEGSSAQAPAVARVPGRVVLDGIATLKSATMQFERFTLEAVCCLSRYSTACVPRSVVTAPAWSLGLRDRLRRRAWVAQSETPGHRASRHPGVQTMGRAGLRDFL
jgi:hypothetical protein